MTVLDVIQRSAGFLSKKGVESPRLQVELLLAHVLGLPRLELYLNFERKLDETELETIRTLVKRRGNREPLQHIVGSTSFCGLEIRVNRHVLVPRPETELLAERAWCLLSKRNSKPSAALDFGTGSGCLAIALAVNCPDADVHALDISTEALDVARENAALNRVDGRIHFHSGDGFAALQKGLSFDVIAANPPYIRSAEIESLMPEVRDYDPHLALDGGPSGLDFYGRLAAKAQAYLRPDGRIVLEFGDGQTDRVRQIFVQHKWIVESVEADYSGQPRIMTACAGRSDESPPAV